MPEEWREKLRTVEAMTSDPDAMELIHEALKRHISLQQWLDLLYLAEAMEEKNWKKWINETFQFPGGGKIVSDSNLLLGGGFGRLTRLPEGLAVKGSLNLTACTGLTELPEGLRVGGILNLDQCTELEKNKNNILPPLMEKMKRGEIIGLSLMTWQLEDRDLPNGLMVKGNLGLAIDKLTELPEGLKVGGSLILYSCTGPTRLTRLPQKLRVEGNLILDENLHEQVKKDAERLKKEGKIKGEIKYR